MIASKVSARALPHKHPPPHFSVLGMPIPPPALPTPRRPAPQVGSYHLDLDIDYVVEALVATFSVLMGRRPRFTAHGGTREENLALQVTRVRLPQAPACLHTPRTSMPGAPARILRTCLPCLACGPHWP